MYKYAFTRKVGLDLTIGSYHKIAPVVETIEPEPEQIVQQEELVETVMEDPDQVPEESESYTLGPFQQETAVVETTEVDSQSDIVSQHSTLNTATIVEDPVEKASTDLRAFIMSNLAVKVEELKGVLGQKIQAQEDNITAQLKRLDEAKDKKNGKK
jgi:hypothetical protein